MHIATYTVIDGAIEIGYVSATNSISKKWLVKSAKFGRCAADCFRISEPVSK